MRVWGPHKWHYFMSFIAHMNELKNKWEEVKLEARWISNLERKFKESFELKIAHENEWRKIIETIVRKVLCRELIVMGSNNFV